MLAFTPDPAVRSQLAVAWGVETFLVPTVRHTDEMVKQVDAALLDIGRCEDGDAVVIVAGSPPGIPGSTNAMRVHRMGDAVNLDRTGVSELTRDLGPQGARAGSVDDGAPGVGVEDAPGDELLDEHAG